MRLFEWRGQGAIATGGLMTIGPDKMLVSRVLAEAAPDYAG